MFKASNTQYSKPLLGCHINTNHPLSRNLNLFWLLNENNGQIVTDMVRKKKGTLTNNAHWEGTKYGPGVFFDGTNDYINCGQIILPNNASISIWGIVKVHVLANLDTYFGMEAFGAQQTFILRNSSAKVELVMFLGGSERILTGATSFIVRNYYMISGVYSRSGMKVYLNGRLDASNTTIGNYALNQIFYIASSAEGLSGRSINGTVISVGVWNRELTPAEQYWLYKEPFAMFQSP